MGCANTLVQIDTLPFAAGMRALEGEVSGLRFLLWIQHNINRSSNIYASLSAGNRT